MKALVRRLRRSLAAPLVLLVAAFIAVPILFYLTFQQADQERQEMLLGSIQAQGRLVAAALQPILTRAQPATFTESAEALR
ncbi:MAG TPA: sensor histidine kinase, partial [Dongiaceae bacterium]